MSKYAEKIRRQIEERRKEQIEKEKKRKEKNDKLSQTKEERDMLKGNFKRIKEIDEEERKKEDKIIKARRQLRKEYLKSLNVGDIKAIQSAEQSMIGYEIGLKIEEQENERGN